MRIRITIVVGIIALLVAGQVLADLVKKYKCKDYVLFTNPEDGKERLVWCKQDDGTVITDKTK